MLKRLFDITFSFLGLAFLSPVFLYLSLRIKWDSKGPVFYRGVRVGKSGKPFRIYKFRTMIIDADKLGGPSTSDDDPRLTKRGKFLRKYKLDELPQLINVLKGEMSFVGPRPEVLKEVEQYDEKEKVLLNVKPGITDWASIEFHDEGAILRGSEDPHKTYREKIRPGKIKLGLRYVCNHSFWVDLKIIAKTLGTLVGTWVGRDLIRVEGEDRCGYE